MLFEPGGLVISAAILLAQAAPVPAAPPPAAASSAQRVSISIAGGAAESARLSLALSDAARRLGIGLELRRVTTPFAHGDGTSLALAPPESGELPMTARLWIDLSDRESVTLYVADDQRERVFVRTFDAPAGVDEVALEQLVLAVSSSIEAILAGHLIGVPRREYEASLKSRKAPPAIPVATVESRSLSFGSVSWAYAASLLGPDALVHGPALGVKLERPRWGIGLWAQARLPVVVGADDANSITLSLTTLGFRYRSWLAFPISERVSVLPGIGVGADFTRVSPRGQPPNGLVAADTYWVADGLLEGYCGVVYRTRGWSLAGALGADVTVRPARYALDLGPSVSDVFVPFRVRPFIELELAANLLP